jgi:hypothetical protein
MVKSGYSAGIDVFLLSGVYTALPRLLPTAWDSAILQKRPDCGFDSSGAVSIMRVAQKNSSGWVRLGTSWPVLPHFQQGSQDSRTKGKTGRQGGVGFGWECDRPRMECLSRSKERLVIPPMSTVMCIVCLEVIPGEKGCWETRRLRCSGICFPARVPSLTARLPISLLSCNDNRRQLKYRLKTNTLLSPKGLSTTWRKSQAKCCWAFWYLDFLRGWAGLLHQVRSG